MSESGKLAPGFFCFFWGFYDFDPWNLVPYGDFIMYMIMNLTSSRNMFPCYWHNFPFYVLVRNRTVDRGYTLFWS